LALADVPALTNNQTRSFRIGPPTAIEIVTDAAERPRRGEAL